MNKQSNVYTIIYASVMVIVVAAVLAYTALLLKEPQTKNVEIDKMKQILSSVNIASDATNAQELYKKYIVNTYVINADGEKIDGVNAFDVNTANQVKKASSDRELPVFVCRLEDGSEKYVIPMNGAGLWGPIWGYVSVDKDGNTIMELILHIRAKLRDWAQRLRNLCFQISIKVSIYLLTVNLSRLL